MLITVKELQKLWDVKPTGVVHVGAHEAEESQDYLEYGFGNVTWIEAQPSLAESLRNSVLGLGDTVIEAAVWDKKGLTMNLNISSNGQSTSLFEFGTHEDSYPDISYVETFEIKTQVLDDLIDSNVQFDFLNLDIQGAELHALRGSISHLSKINWIYTEVNREKVYLNCALVKEIDEFLADHGFVRTTTRWCIGKGWGDALYIKKDLHKTFKKPIARLASISKWYITQFLKLIASKIFKLFWKKQSDNVKK